MTKTLEFSIPEGCTDIAFGLDLNRDGIKREDCEKLQIFNWGWDKGSIFQGGFDSEGIYAYKLKSAPKAEPQDWQPVSTYAYRAEKVLVRNSQHITCAYGTVAGEWSTDSFIGEVTHWMPIPTPTTPATVKVEVELPAPSPGKKWERGADSETPSGASVRVVCRTWVEGNE